MSVDSRTIVVGVDSSNESSEALDWARRAAGPEDRIVVVHAWEVPMVVGYDTVIAVDTDQIADLATQGVNELVERADDDRLVAVVVQDHPGRALISELEANDGDMVVVGHAGSGRASVVLGSTANYVLHHTKSPVVVVRGEHVEAPRVVVVGVDDHDLDQPDDENESVRALRWAYGLASATEVRVVHAWFVPSVALGPWSNPGADFDDMDAAARKVVDHVFEAAGPVPDRVRVTGEPANGTPEFALIEASADADLVVVGSKGRGGFATMLLGSTSIDVASYSHSPVAIIR